MKRGTTDHAVEAWRAMAKQSFADAKTIADLRDRLRVMGCHLCRDCGCAPRDADMPRCWDCDDVRTVFEDRDDPQDSTPASAVVVGLRALCGRRILEGC